MATQAPKMTSEDRSSRRGMSSILPLLLVLALLAFAFSFWGYSQTKKKLAVLTDPKQANELTQKQTDELLAKIGKLVLLPDEAAPVVATINDVETLAAKQDFYVNATNGQKLVIFPTSRKALIYDEGMNKIINYGPVFYSTDDGTTAPNSVNEDGRISIDLRNGSTTSDLGVTTRDSLITNHAFNVLRLAKAANANYSGITIVDQTSGNKTDLVNSLAKQLGATVTKDLPADEPKSNAEVIVILGKK